MNRGIAVLVTIIGLAGASHAQAQTRESSAGPGGNVIASAPAGSPVVPCVTGGGVKRDSGRRGLRGDHRFVAVRSNDEAPAFSGQETRDGHRVYGGIILTVAR